MTRTVRGGGVQKGAISWFVLLGAALAAAPSPAEGQESVPRIFAERRDVDSSGSGRSFMITPWAGYISGGSFQNSANNDVLYVNDSAGFGFILDLLDTPRAYYELLYSFQRTDLGGVDTPGWPSHLDLDIHYLQIGGMYEFPRERVRPFIVGGIGLTAIVPDGRDSSTNLSFSLGGGVQIPLSERFALRIEGRGLLTVISDETEIFCASSGAGGGCAVGVEGDSLAQFEVLAGLSFGL